MKEKPVTEAVARRFLLGAVDDSERQEIESLFMIDPEIKETILIAEDELIEDYLEGSLSELDTAKFLEQYSHAPRQRRKLRIAESIKEHALAEFLPDQMATSAIQRVLGLVSSRWPKNRRLFIPVAVAVTTVLIITAIWLVQWNNRRLHENNLRAAIERELTELNAPSGLRENPPQMISLILPPVSLRSVNSRAEVTPRAAYRVIELHLLWPRREEYQSYIAVLRRIGGSEKFTIPSLHAEKNPGGKVVRLRLPAQSLDRGLYQVSLTAIASDGTSGPTEEYDFAFGD